MSDLTPKQEAFCLAYIATGNACESYRRAYDASAMAQRTVEKRASELLKNGEVTGRINALRAEAATKATLSRAWVLERLMRNARIALGEEKVTVATAARGNGAKGAVVELAVTQRDANAANRALELLGRTEEVGGLFIERHEHTGRNGQPIETTEIPLTPYERARRIAYILGQAGKAANGSVAPAEQEGPE